MAVKETSRASVKGDPVAVEEASEISLVLLANLSVFFVNKFHTALT